MSKEDLNAGDFLGHILQAADRILQYTNGMTREEFFTDTLKQDAVIRNIEIIGEAVNNLLEAEPGIAAKYPSIPFAEIYGMRNRVAHGYFAVGLNMVSFGLRGLDGLLPIKRIVIGPCPHMADAIESLKGLLIRKGYRRMEISPSQIPFRNW